MNKTMMNKTESDRIHELCSMIAVEQDRRKFLELVSELNHILERNDQRLKELDHHPAKGNHLGD